LNLYFKLDIFPHVLDLHFTLESGTRTLKDLILTISKGDIQTKEMYREK